VEILFLLDPNLGRGLGKIAVASELSLTQPPLSDNARCDKNRGRGRSRIWGKE
jgi:hypothetical protein